MKGKLRDQYDKLIGKKTQNKIIITEERIANTIRYVTSGILDSGYQGLVS